MRYQRKRGATSVKTRIYIPDSSLTTVMGLTGLTNASTNLAIAFTRENDNGGTEVTGANIADIATIGTWASPGTGKLGFKAVDAAKFPGLYEIHFPDDSPAFGSADASRSVIINIYEKTTTALHIGPNMVQIPLSAYDIAEGEVGDPPSTTACIATCTVAAGSTTTSIVTSACSPAGSSLNQFFNRSVVFSATTTTAGLRGAMVPITASTAAALPVLTVGTCPATPVAGDTFRIV